jgi:LysM repeat protein
MPSPVTQTSETRKRTKAPARIVAIIALIAAAVALAAVVSGSVGGDSDSGSKAQYGSEQKQKKQRTKASSYVVESGDTLTSIAHKTGIPVKEIQELNPEVDPQILIAGEKLKLK